MWPLSWRDRLWWAALLGGAALAALAWTVLPHGWRGSPLAWTVRAGQWLCVVVMAAVSVRGGRSGWGRWLRSVALWGSLGLMVLALSTLRPGCHREPLEWVYLAGQAVCLTGALAVRSPATAICVLVFALITYFRF